MSPHQRIICISIAITVTGKTLGENLKGAEVYNDDVIRTVEKSDLCRRRVGGPQGQPRPDGCVIKPSACEPRFLKHTGPALVFDDYASMKKAIDDPDLDVTRSHPDLAHAGRKAVPACRNGACCRSRRRLVKQGVRDRCAADARMASIAFFIEA